MHFILDINLASKECKKNSQQKIDQNVKLKSSSVHNTQDHMHNNTVNLKLREAYHLHELSVPPLMLNLKQQVLGKAFCQSPQTASQWIELTLITRGDNRDQTIYIYRIINPKRVLPLRTFLRVKSSNQIPDTIQITCLYSRL